MEFKSVQKFFRSHIIMIISATLFLLGTFVLTRFLNFFISPDETANAFFARAFAHTGSFRVLDTLSSFNGNMLHPRSIVMDWDYWLPASFLGLSFLYGCIIAIVGSWSLTFLTPIIVVLAALAWNQILQHWFSKRIAFISSLLFLFHPAIWYYSARGLMPNVLFVCCVVFSVWFLVTADLSHALSFERRGVTDPNPNLNPNPNPSPNPSPPSFRRRGLGGGLAFLFSGLFLGLALFIRLSEIYWLIPLFLFLLYVDRKSYSFQKYVFIAIGFLISMLLMLFLNFKTYGNPFVFGYSFVGDVTGQDLSQDLSHALSFERRGVMEWWQGVVHVLLPFGFHPRGILSHTWDYFFVLFWWLTIPSLCAIPLFLRDRKQKIFLFVTIAIAFWLCIWYGSWKLNDNPDPTLVTIANSYVRYWLPIFVLSTPFVATTLVWIADRFSKVDHAKGKFGRKILVSLMLLLIASNIRIVFFEGPDALRSVAATLEQSMQIRDRVLAIVPEDGVIITDRSDKLFFPARHVLVPLRSEKTFNVMSVFVDRFSLYYYGITLPASDLNFLNQQKLDPLGLRIHMIETFGVESLYQFKSRREEK